MAFTKIYLTVIKQQISLLKWFLYDYTTLKIQLWHNRKYVFKIFIKQCYRFTVFFNQINAVIVNIRDFFKKH